LTYTHGAAALLEIRGGEQVQREGGFDIFSALRNTVVRRYMPTVDTLAKISQLLGCLQKKERFPKVLIDLHDQMTSKLQIDLLGVYSDHLVKISARFCNLQAHIKDGGFQDDMKIFSIAMEIDSELEEFSHGLFAGFPFNLGT
jgi:hypothetical protein